MEFHFRDVLKWLTQETGCKPEVAQIALEHARGNVFQARDLLQNEMYRSFCEKEAREYGRES